MQAILKELSSFVVLDPEYGDLKLNLFPINVDFLLPRGFRIWQHQVAKMLSFIPRQTGANDHFVTIDSRFFTNDALLRREGVHIDGNFCVDKTFPLKTWGGSEWVTETQTIREAFVSPYGTKMPLGTYVSDSKGGLLCASSFAGCEAWTGDMADLKIGNEGACNPESLTNKSKHLLAANVLYFMTSNTPHQTLITNAGQRRSLIRITLHHNYDNSRIIDNNLFLVAA